MNPFTKELMEEIDLNHLGNIVLSSLGDPNKKGSQTSKRFSDLEIISTFVSKDLGNAEFLAEDMIKSDRVYNKLRNNFPIREKGSIIEKLISL